MGLNIKLIDHQMQPSSDMHKEKMTSENYECKVSAFWFKVRHFHLPQNSVWIKMEEFNTWLYKDLVFSFI